MVQKRAPLQAVVGTIHEMMRERASKVTKKPESEAIRFDFKFPSGSFMLMMMQRSDGLHQVVRAQVSIDRKDRKEVCEAVAYGGDRLDVHPVTLGELNGMSSVLGSVVQRLLQSAVSSDGKTNHLEIVAGRMAG